MTRPNKCRTDGTLTRGDTLYIFEINSPTVHPKICIFSAGQNKKMSVRYRGDETEREKAEIFITANNLVRDLGIAVKAID
jgi:hypothetical protein